MEGRAAYMNILDANAVFAGIAGTRMRRRIQSIVIRQS
jgi:hypothetical protein